jgi:hypothetical protein
VDLGNSVLCHSERSEESHYGLKIFAITKGDSLNKIGEFA